MFYKGLNNLDSGYHGSIIKTTKKGQTNMKNKIAQKYFFPKFAIFSAYIVLITGMTCVAVDAIQKNKTEQDKSSAAPYLVGLGIVITAITYFIICVHSDIRDFTHAATQTYVKKAISNNQDLQKFETLTTDPRALRYIAAFVSNNISPAEMKQILDCIKKSESAMTMEATEKAYQEISKIVEKHVAEHPDFAYALYKEMFYASHRYNPEKTKQYS